MKSIIKTFFISGVAAFTFNACSLDEMPMDTLVPDNTFTSPVGFELALNTLYNDFRVYTSTTEGAYIGFGFHMPDYLQVFSDVAAGGQLNRNQCYDYRTLTSTHTAVSYYWDQAYSRMIKNANIILSNLDKATWESDAQRRGIEAEALWFRALAYRYLICLYGDVPWVDKEIKEVKLDFVREKREVVLDNIIKDLEYSSANLPENPDAVDDGRLTKAAANQLLAFCYLFKGNLTNNSKWYDKVVEVTSWIIDSPYYELMKGKFGEVPPAWRMPAGDTDPYPYLHWQNNTMRKAHGNRETILDIQTEYNVKGGISGYSNQLVRRWGPSYFNLITPDNYKMILTDTIGRSISFVRPTEYATNTVYEGKWAKDLRNTDNSIRRNWYWNNSESQYYGQQVDASNMPEAAKYESYAPMFRKVEGLYTNLSGGVNDNKNTYYMRLAETYLLRAEAYLMLEKKDLAANDLNEVRNRAQANPVSPEEVTLDFILDERCRELIIEEPRLLTLSRLGKEVTLNRIRKYNYQVVSGIEMAAATIQDFNWLWPIPQSVIDANLENHWENNPGYK